MSETKAKRVMFGHVAGLAQALAHPLRIEIVDLLAQAPRSGDTLAVLMDQSRANVSQHLQSLRSAGVVARRRDGKRVEYRLADDVVVLLYEFLGHAADTVVAEASLTRQTRYAPLDPQMPLSVAELAPILVRGKAQLIDVRPAEEYAFDHIAGAISLPVSTLPDRLAELPIEPEFIAYCRGPHCTYAYEAVSALRESGRRARRLRGGYLGWRSCKLISEGRNAICGSGADADLASRA